MSKPSPLHRLTRHLLPPPAPPTPPPPPRQPNNAQQMGCVEMSQTWRIWLVHVRWEDSPACECEVGREWPSLLFFGRVLMPLCVTLTCRQRPATVTWCWGQGELHMYVHTHTHTHAHTHTHTHRLKPTVNPT